MRELTAPGDLVAITIGAVQISAQLAVGQGVTITVWQGPSRHDAVAFSYTDRALARRRYAQIRQLAASGLTAEQIDAHINGPGNAAVAAVRDLLAEATEQAAADPAPAAGRLTSALAAERTRLDTVAETARLDALAARINADLDGCTPTLPARSFAEIRDRHAAALAADRKQVA